MSLEDKKKRLIFRSDHRGTKEMDLIMGSFALRYVPDFNETELAAYEEILTHNDPDLYNWLSRKEKPPEDLAACSVFQKLMNHKLAA